MSYKDLYTDKFIDAFARFNELSLEEQKSILSDFEMCLGQHWKFGTIKAHDRTLSKCGDLGLSGGMYCQPEEILDCEELLISIFYPFWERIGPAFADEFAADGRMLKYIMVLKKRDIQYQLSEIVKTSPFDYETFREFVSDTFDVNEPFPKDKESSYIPTTLLMEADKTGNREAIVYLLEHARRQKMLLDNLI